VLGDPEPNVGRMQKTSLVFWACEKWCMAKWQMLCIARENPPLKYLLDG